ncbi:hypothetical protein MMC29_004870 [Sticta canariensis]|nr:hypothetical protein [Sticta canariensis]
MASKGDATGSGYHQIVGCEDDDDFTTRYRRGSNSEEPKIALGRRLRSSKFFIHMIALATTSVVVGVNFANVYGWDQDSLHLPDNQVRNLLQFAAKLHEILIVGSLTSIIMHHIRERLVRSRGLSLGLLSSGYQVSSMEFLFSKSFRGAFCTDTGLILTLAATIITVNVVGPSSAIVVIPRLDWWGVRAAFNNTLQLYLGGSFDQLYPTKFGPLNMTLFQGCDTAEYTSGCPGGAFDDLKNWAASWYNNGVAPNINAHNSHHYPDPAHTPTGLFWNYIQENSMGKINKIKKPMLVSTNTAPVYAPVIQVECNWFNYSEAIKSPGPQIPTVSFPLDVLDNYTGISTSIEWPLDPSLWNFTRPMNATNFTWIDVSSYSDGDGPGASLGVLITLPTLAMNETYSNGTFWDLSQQSWLIPCLINAKWAAANIRYVPNESNQIIQNITDMGVFDMASGQKVTKASRQPWGLSNTIHISPEWASLLNVAGIASTSASGESLNATMVEALLSQFVICDINEIYSPYMALGAKFKTFVTQTVNVVPATIAAVIAEGLSRQAYNRTEPYMVFVEGQNNTKYKRLTQQKGWNPSGIGTIDMGLAAFDEESDAFLTPIDFTIKRYGYGHGWQGSFTVAFALAVLLTHAVVAFGYILYSIYNRIAGTGFTSRAWGDIGEMLALALHSERARELQNVGGGVEARSTWEMRVRVRERGGDRLELVVGTESLGGAKPQLDKMYR